MSKCRIDLLLAVVSYLSTHFQCRSNRRINASLPCSSARSTGVWPKRSSILVEAPCFSSTSMKSVLLNITATCRALSWSSSLRLSTSAPLFNKTRVTSVLFSNAVDLSAVSPSPSTLSTGTPASRSSISKLMSPSRAASKKRLRSSLSISRREEFCLQNSDEIAKVWWFVESYRSNFFQTIMHMETKSFLVQIKLSAMNKSQLILLEIHFPSNQI